MFILLICAVTLLAALVQGITGFGYALVAAPLLAILLSERESILVILAFTTVINCYLFIRYKKQVKLNKMRKLVLPAILGVVAGSLLLPYIPEGVLTILIGVASLYLAFTMLVGLKKKIKYEKAVNYAGVASGFFNVTTGLGGLPIVLLMEQQKTQKKQMVGSLAAFFLALNIVTIAGLVMSVEVTQRLPGIMLFAFPAAIVGLIIGVVIGERIKEKVFHKFVLVLIVLCGSLALYKGLNTFLG